MNNSSLTHKERGSVIIWILIAIGLFAALGYAFSKSSSNSVSMLTDEQSKAYANQILAYGNEIRQAIKRLQLRGCSDTEISFENPVGSNLYPNPNAPSDKSCHIYDTAGGGLQFSTPKGASSEPNFIANLTITGHGEDCANSSCSDLILGIRISDYALTDSKKQKGKIICNKINEALGYPATTTDLEIGDDTIGGYSIWRFLGVYNYTNTINVAGINGKKRYCASVNALNQIFVYHQVLIAR